MALIACICPNCGTEFETDANRGRVLCPCCGTGYDMGNAGGAIGEGASESWTSRFLSSELSIYIRTPYFCRLIRESVPENEQQDAYNEICAVALEVLSAQINNADTYLEQYSLFYDIGRGVESFSQTAAQQFYRQLIQLHDQYYSPEYFLNALFWEKKKMLGKQAQYDAVINRCHEKIAEFDPTYEYEPEPEPAAEAEDDARRDNRRVKLAYLTLIIAVIFAVVGTIIVCFG